MLSKIRSTTFLTGYFIYLASFYIMYASNYQMLLNNTSISYKSMYYIATILILISILMLKKNLVEWIFNSLILVIGLITLKTSNDNLFMISCLFIVASQGINFSAFLKLDITFRTLLFLVVAISNKLGIIADAVLYRSDGFARTAFGFLQPNTAGALVLSIVLEFIILKFNKINLLDGFIICVTAGMLFYTTNSRSSVIGIMLALILTIVFKSNLKKILVSKLFLSTMSLIPFILAILSYAAVKLYNSGSTFLIVMDKLFSGRIHLINYFINTYQLKLFGQHIQFADSMNLRNTYFLVMDNSYISILLKYGILPFCMFLILYYLKIKKVQLDANGIPELIAILVMCAVGLMETELFYPAYNITLLYLMNYRNKKAENYV
ncbi:O-antigen ligase family protein [Pediococcus pentosaceus]|uniref:O-antigen ligase family protein n=1 Tax=Pediococcus pentosaceus TaxID=1255 RepID=UPI0021E77FA6|nr:O-antigen ligase family protein [Pediococcus pentosaceus]MCV3325608.1 O-antigen ligase family protein [Pediococcus pentosaceus]